ncbi:MAG TPA: methyltransferase domain-containing protein [Candidatus Monoglobus merdigallinarum]|uniref:Methyltransferase domain-containing protein n=1 Tax=Candidatus Monoglobus merdigallinarum TaxID=2838698 RepID=A0A9D1TLR2_9FIRM|nr:methyltransferase domain-containing protein [Candidatus Monoglobus merdigallinarum]
MSDWSSKQYIKFKAQRTQPSLDLIHRISDTEPNSILDIGCGPGNSTSALAAAFPHAEITGIDASDDMLCRARSTYPNLQFEQAYVPDGLDKFKRKYDLIFSNACIHWIPNQEELIKKVFGKLSDGGVFAVQIPLVQEAPFYKILWELIKAPRWEKLSDIRNFHNLLPEEYYDLFSAMNCDFEMWQTSYYHIMESTEGIIEWYKGSGLRPYLDALPASDQDALVNALRAALNDYYTPQADSKIIMKMPRLFFILKSA